MEQHVRRQPLNSILNQKQQPTAVYRKKMCIRDRLGVVLNKLQEDDLLIITADHGNDPTYKGTDHTKEMVPFLAYSPRMEGHGLLPVSDTFAMIGATIADNFEVSMPKNTIGTSCLKQLK